MLPGAEAVLYTIARRGSPDFANGDIAVFSLSSGESKVLVNGGSSPHYVPTGHIVYAFAGSLRAVGFDLDKLGLTLETRPIFGLSQKALRKDFDGDVPPELGVARSVDVTYSARAERRDDFVGAEACSGGEMH